MVEGEGGIDVSKRNYWVFDIETGPLADEVIARIAPPFDPDEVKVGNAGIEKAMEKINAAKDAHLRNIKARAALKAEYGEVLAIGYANAADTVMMVDLPEDEMLDKFWQRADESYHSQETFVGFNVMNFDLPFLIRRSIINGVRVPPGLLPRNNRYFPDFFVDLMQMWQAGDYREMISLDRFAKALGHEGKNGSGKFFAQTLKEDEGAAMEYLRNDLLLTRKVAEACFRAY